MALILARHTQLSGADGLCYGRADVPLADSFETEASALEAVLPALQGVITSPSPRCLKLAEWIGRRRGILPVADTRFQEMDFGNWQGRLWDDIPRAEIDLWTHDFWNARPHGGESVMQLAARVSEGLKAYANVPGTQLIITHAGVIRAALAADGDEIGWNAQIDYAAPVFLAEVIR